MIRPQQGTLFMILILYVTHSIDTNYTPFEIYSEFK